MPSYSTTREPVTPIFPVIFRFFVEYSADIAVENDGFTVEFFSFSVMPKEADFTGNLCG